MTMARRSQSKRGGRATREPQARDGSDLCLQCGLCCDGTVFSDISLLDEEEDFVVSLGLHPSRGAGKQLLAPQPCPAFVDGCCSLYTRGRPQTCHTYACGLLRGYTEGTATLDDALGVVRLVRSLAHELEDEMGLPLGGYNRARVRAHLDEVRPHDHPQGNETFLVAFHRLMGLGVKYFEYAPRPEEEAAAEAGGAVAAESTTT
jgi:uncharacterized protein